MKDQKMRLAYFPLGRIHFASDRAQQLSNQFRAELDLLGIKIFGGETVLWNVNDVQQSITHISGEDIDLNLVFQTTFTDSTMVMEIARKVSAPIVLWSIPEEWDGNRLELNSFTGMHLAAHALHKNQFPYFYIYADVNDPTAFEKLHLIARAAHVVHKLKSSKIGLVGIPPTGFETSEYNGEQIKMTFGATIENISLQDMFSRINSISEHRIRDTRHSLEKSIANLENLDQTATDKTLATYKSLLDLGEEKELDGLAVRCWPEFFEELECSACGALSLTTEKGIACSCEADVFGTITQLILQTLSSSPALGADLVGFDLDENTAAIWHCGMAPESMANPKYPVEATTHSNRGLPLLMQFPFKPGRITLARLTQADEQIKLIVGMGKMLDRPRPFTGTCGVFQFENSASQVLDTIISIGMEHHISFTYGDYRTELEMIAKLLGLATIHV